MLVRYSIVIPAWNEASSIEHALRETGRVFREIGEAFEIIVVDDGSSDGTAEVVTSYVSRDDRVRLIRHEKNSGKGAAVKTGAMQAAGEWLLFLDVDLAVHPQTFKAWLPLLDTSDVIIGSRRVKGAAIAVHQPKYRERFGEWFNLAVRRIIGLPFQDTQCGFKAFRLPLCRPLFINLDASGWAFDVELLAQASKAGLRLREEPVEWRNGTKSRVRLGQAPAILLELLKIKRKTG